MKKYADNSFNAGLNLDDNPITIDNNSLTNCLNGTLITYNGNEYILQNDLGNGRVETAALPQGYVPVGVKEHGGVVYVASVRPKDGMCQIGSFPSPERNISTEEINDNSDSSINPESYFNSGTFTIKKKLFEGTKINPGDKLKIYLKDPNIIDESTNQPIVIKDNDGKAINEITKDGYVYKITPAIQTEDSGLKKLNTDYITGEVLLPYSEKEVGELYVLIELNYTDEFSVYNSFDASNNLEFTFEGEYDYVLAKFVKTDNTYIQDYVKLTDKKLKLQVDQSDGILQYQFTPCIGQLTNNTLNGIEIKELTLEGIVDTDPNKQYDMNLNNFDATWKEDKSCWQVNYALSGMADVTDIELNLYYYNPNASTESSKWVYDRQGSTSAPRKSSYNGSFNINLFPSQKQALYYLEIKAIKANTSKSFYNYLMSNGLLMQYVTNSQLPQDATLASPTTKPANVTGGSVYKKTINETTWYYYVKDSKVTHMGAANASNVVQWSPVQDFYQLTLNIGVDGDLKCVKKDPVCTKHTGNSEYQSNSATNFKYGETWTQEFEINGSDYTYYVTEQQSISKIVPSGVVGDILKNVKVQFSTDDNYTTCTPKRSYASGGNYTDETFVTDSESSETVSLTSDSIKLTTTMPYIMRGDHQAVVFQSDTPRFGAYLENASDFKHIFGYEGDLTKEVAEYGLSGAWGRTKDNNFRTKFGLRKYGGNDSAGTNIKSHEAYNNASDSAGFSDQPNDQTWYWKPSGNRTSVHDKYQSFLTDEFGKVPPVSFWIGTSAWEDYWDSKDSGVPNDCSGYLTTSDAGNYTYNFVFVLWKHSNGMYYISNQKFPKQAQNNVPTALQVLMHYFKNLYVYKSDIISQSSTKYKMKDYKFVTDNTVQYDINTQVNWAWVDSGKDTMYNIQAPTSDLKNIVCYFVPPSTKLVSAKVETDKQSIAAEVQKYANHNPTSEAFGVGIQIESNIVTKDVNGKDLDKDTIYYLDSNNKPRPISDTKGFTGSAIATTWWTSANNITSTIFEDVMSRLTFKNNEIVLGDTGTLVKKTSSRTSSGAFSIGDYFGSDDKHGLKREAAFVFTSSENQPYVMKMPLVTSSGDIKSYGS